MRRLTSVPLALLLTLLIAGTAAAGTCVNLSRPGPSEPTAGPIIRGNWVWLPSIGVQFEAWGFAPPGVFPGLPGENGNYQDGATVSLLGLSASCDPTKETSRQTSNGVQSGCE